LTKLKILLILLISHILISQENKYEEISKNFEIFTSIYREVYLNYLYEINDEKLLKTALDGMLKGLDPYTIFSPYDDKQENDIISNGGYIGFGISVGIINGQLTVTDVNFNGPAYIGGLSIGDRILKIDTTNVSTMNNEEFRWVVKGKIGDSSKFVIKDYKDEVKTLFLKRALIDVKDINYTKVIQDSIVYINLDRFTIDSHREIQQSIRKANENSQIKGVILDLRNNPGGLLKSAIKICELFLPQNSLIVSTRGRNERKGQSYYTEQVPEFPKMKLIVLINEYSASASEVIAGAIQDLDRGLIIGRQSFGKGLVQSVIKLPYSNELNLTSAKYYTPSGRCIQKVSYGKEPKKELKNYTTLAGRKVTDAEGITPDTILKEKKQELKYEVRDSEIFSFVSRKALNSNLNNYENLASELLDSLLNKTDIYLNDKELQGVEKYLKKLDKNFYESKLESSFKEIERGLKDFKEQKLKESKSELAKEIEIEVLRRNINQELYYTYLLKNDEYIATSLNYFNDYNYKNLLTKKPL